MPAPGPNRAHVMMPAATCEVRPGLMQFFGTIGAAFENAVVESFWARMQTELLNRRRWTTRVKLSTEIFEWIEVFSNRVRRHSRPNSRITGSGPGGQIRWYRNRGSCHAGRAAANCCVNSHNSLDY
jgi:hypothetical protein